MAGRLGGMNRDEATRRVLHALGRRPNKRALYRDDSGSTPIVVALPNEHVSEVLNRVRTIGGRSNVAVAFAKNYRVVTMGSGGAVAEDESDDPIVINQDLSMGMLLIRMDKNPGRNLRFVFRDVNASVPEGAEELTYA